MSNNLDIIDLNIFAIVSAFLILIVFLYYRWWKFTARILKKALQGLLDDEEISLISGGFDIVGDIAVLKIPDSLIEKKNIIGNRPMFYSIDPHEGIDIDEQYEFDFAEFLYKKYKN